MIVISGLVLLIIGGFGGYQLANTPKIRKMQENKAIQEHFKISSNEYTYFTENAEEGSFILSTGDQEYRIKFSDNKPLRVVYVEEVLLTEEVE